MEVVQAKCRLATCLYINENVVLLNLVWYGQIKRVGQ
jgi:hypothetical protein